MFDSQITFCYTEDISLIHDFYHTVMELPMVLDQGGCRIYRVAGDAYLGFCTSKRSGCRNTVTITLVTDNVDFWFSKAKAAGCQVIREPAATTEYKIYNCFLKDPAGYTLEIQRFEDLRWPPEE